MQFDRYEESRERKRLTGPLEARAVRTGAPAIFLFLFGLPFVGLGVGAILVGARLILPGALKINAPYWLLTVFGLVFAAGGGLVWSMGWRLARANRRRRELASRAPELADYPWNPRGFAPPRWARVSKGIGGLVFLALFLSMFNWWAFWANGPWPVKLIVGVFDGILVLAGWQVGIVLGRTLKFGPSRIEFARFPYRPGEPLLLHWVAPAGLSRAVKGEFTLRCVEEWYETRGSGKNRQRALVQEQTWGATGHLDQPQDILPGKTEDLRYELPSDAAGTTLCYRGEKAVFWELGINLDLEGLDFKETYLVPVYRQAAAGGVAPAPIRLKA